MRRRGRRSLECSGSAPRRVSRRGGELADCGAQLFYLALQPFKAGLRPVRIRGSIDGSTLARAEPADVIPG
jgi:hypothetical protein